ncbi:MAG: DUF2474 family protein [Sphingorhabdus lacus]
MPNVRQIGWFASIWALSVAALAIVGGIIRWVLV